MQSIVIPTSCCYYSFKSCNWTNCESSDAGAITFRDKTTSSLAVTYCTFLCCISTNDDYTQSGGAINAYNVYSVSISFSSFITCTSTKSRGDGINMSAILYHPYIHNSTCISCFSFDDGEGAAI